MKKLRFTGLLLAGMALVLGLAMGCSDNLVIEGDDSGSNPRKIYEPLIVYGIAGGQNVEVQFYTDRPVGGNTYTMQTGDSYEIRTGENRKLTSSGKINKHPYTNELTFVPSDGSPSFDATWDGTTLTFLDPAPDLDGISFDDFTQTAISGGGTTDASDGSTNRVGADMVSSTWTAGFDTTTNAGSLTLTPIADPPTNPGNQTVEYALGTGSTAPTTGWQDGTVFSSLFLPNVPGLYYAWARSKANDDYNAGTAKRSSDTYTLYSGAAVQTDWVAGLAVGSVKITYDAKITGSNPGDQDVEYALGTGLNVPTGGWQIETTFENVYQLITGDYTAWARTQASLGANAGYISGTATQNIDSTYSTVTNTVTSTGNGTDPNSGTDPSDDPGTITVINGTGLMLNPNNNVILAAGEWSTFDLFVFDDNNRINTAFTGVYAVQMTWGEQAPLAWPGQNRPKQWTEGRYAEPTITGYKSILDITGAETLLQYPVYDSSPDSIPSIQDEDLANEDKKLEQRGALGSNNNRMFGDVGTAVIPVTFVNGIGTLQLVLYGAAEYGQILTFGIDGVAGTGTLVISQVAPGAADSLATDGRNFYDEGEITETTSVGDGSGLVVLPEINVWVVDAYGNKVTSDVNKTMVLMAKDPLTIDQQFSEVGLSDAAKLYWANDVHNGPDQAILAENDYEAVYIGGQFGYTAVSLFYNPYTTPRFSFTVNTSNKILYGYFAFSYWTGGGHN